MADQSAGPVMPQPNTSIGFPLRPNETVLFVSRWEGGWANSIATYVLIGIVSLAGVLLFRDFFFFLGLLLGFLLIMRLIMDIISRTTGRAVLTNQRIVVKRIPAVWTNKEIELRDVAGLDASVDVFRAGAGMSKMTIISPTGVRSGIVIPNASSLAVAYTAYFHPTPRPGV